MRSLAIAFIGCMACVSAWGQALNDFRTVASGDWNVNTPWETFDGNAWVPAQSGPVLGDGAITIRSGHNIRWPQPQPLDQVTIASGGTITIPAGINMPFPNVNADIITIASGGTLDVAGTITFQANAKLRVSGTVIGRNTSTTASFSGSSATNHIYLAGSTFNHAYTTNAGTVPTASWDAASTLLFTGGATTTTTAPSGLSAQSFGNVTYNISAGTGVLTLAGNFTNIQGSFSTLSTHTRPITFATLVSNYSLTINGDLNLAGTGAVILNTATSGTNTLNVIGSYNQTSSINFTAASAGGNTNANINIGKNFTKAGGTFQKLSSGTATMNFNQTNPTFLPQVFNASTTGTPFIGIAFVVLSGSTLQITETSAISGAGGSFTLNNGATVIVESIDTNGAISSTGNIKVTTRTFQSGSTIIYHNNTTTQYLGTDHPTTAGVTTVVNNALGVNLAPPSVVLNGALTLTNGNFNISNRDFTIGGAFTPGANFLVADANTTLRIADGPTLPSLRLSGTSVIGSFYMSGSTGRTVQLGANLTVANDANFNKGDLQLNGFELELGGSVFQTAGTVTADASSTIEISDISPAAVPPSLTISGSALGTLTMNKVGETFTTGSNLSVSTLNLTAGTLTHTGTITITALGKVNVGTGILTNLLAAASQYDVEYNGTDEADTGKELPTSGTTLRHLIVSNPVQVNLKAPGTVVNGDLILQAGNFFADTTDITLRGNFQSDASSDLIAGTTFFDGTSTITGSIPPQFGNVTVNATKSMALSSNMQINVAGNFAQSGTFTANQGTVSLNGTTAQFLTGGVTTTFYGLEVNKASAGVTVQHAVQIEDVLRVLTDTQITAGTNLLTLISTAGRTARVNPLTSGAAINGSVVVQRYLPNGAGLKTYRYIASPVTNTNVADWQQEFPITGTFTDPSSGGTLIPTEISMYSYDESFTTNGTGLDDRYRNFPSSGTAASNPLVNGKGYVAYTYTFGTLTFDSRGTLGQQQIPVNVTAQSAGGNDGWNLLGNPYPSPVLWDKVTKTGGVNAVYIPDRTNINGGGFMTYVGGVGTPANYDGTIDMAQAFWVHATSNGTVTFNEADKIISTDSVPQFFRQGPPSDLLRIKIASTAAKDEIAIRFLDEATDTFDTQYDALKMKGTTVNLSSMSSDSREMTINTMGSMACLKRVPLTITEAQAGSYTFTASGFDSFGSDADITLIDNKTSATIDLRKTNSYDFSVTAQELTALKTRFVIEVGKTRVLTDLPLGGPTICFNDFTGDIIVSNTQPEIEYQVFSGQTAVSDLTRGNSGDINLTINTKSLPVGNTTFTISAKNSCVTETMDKTAIVVKAALTPAPQVADVSACSSDVAVLKASGALAGQSYSWYISADATTPVAVTTDGNYQVTGLTGNISYYVSVSNSLGCQGERREIDVKVVNPDPVEINQNGTILTSSYFTGNQWYLDGAIIAGQNAPSLNATESGTYTVKVNVGGCVTEASIVQEITGLEETASDVDIYPNPVGANMNIAFPAGIAGASGVSIVNTSGKIVYSGSFTAPGVVTIDTSDIAAGIYIVRLEVDGQIISRKIIKL